MDQCFNFLFFRVNSCFQPWLSTRRYGVFQVKQGAEQQGEDCGDWSREQSNSISFVSLFIFLFFIWFLLFQVENKKDEELEKKLDNLTDKLLGALQTGTQTPEDGQEKSDLGFFSWKSTTNDVVTQTLGYWVQNLHFLIFISTPWRQMRCLWQFNWGECSFGRRRNLPSGLLHLHPLSGIMLCGGVCFGALWYSFMLYGVRYGVVGLAWGIVWCGIVYREIFLHQDCLTWIHCQVCYMVGWDLVSWGYEISLRRLQLSLCCHPCNV